jgi:hypothetical protein
LLRKFIACLALLLLIVPTVDANQKPRAEVLGLRLGMLEDEVRERLAKIGEQQKEERESEGEGEQEVWLLNPKLEKNLDYLVVKFDRNHRLHFIIAVARKDGHVRYADVLDLQKAKRVTDGSGRNFSFTWKIAAEGAQPASQIVARGSDPQYLTSYTIFRLNQ